MLTIAAVTYFVVLVFYLALYSRLDFDVHTRFRYLARPDSSFLPGTPSSQQRRPRSPGCTPGIFLYEFFAQRCDPGGPQWRIFALAVFHAFPWVKVTL